MVNVILLVTDKEFELREKSTFARGKKLAAGGIFRGVCE